MTIRLVIPAIDEDDVSAVVKVLRSGMLVQGPAVARFEELVADHVGVEHAVAVSSGTAALHLALLAINIKPGDVVLTSPFSWPATANAVEVCGAIPLFVDISAVDFNIDIQQLQEQLENGLANGLPIKAIMPVHAFGVPANMPRIVDLAKRYCLAVIEDAACALGARIDGRYCGAWGTVGCFSFHPRKTITTGEGGMVVTNDEQIANRIRSLRNHGLSSTSTTPSFVDAGLNYRLTEMQGALGVTQVQKLQRLIESRQKIAKRYDEMLGSTCIQPQSHSPNCVSNYQSYVVMLPAASIPKRNDVIVALHQAEIQATIGTWNIPDIQYYQQKYGVGARCPTSREVHLGSIAIPLHEHITADEQKFVVKTLVDAITCD